MIESIAVVFAHACALVAICGLMEQDRRLLAIKSRSDQRCAGLRASIQDFIMQYDVSTIPTHKVLEALLSRAGGVYIGDGSIYGQRPGITVLFCVGCDCPPCNRRRRDAIIGIMEQMNEQGASDGEDGGECQ